MKSGELKGIIWQHGESDCDDNASRLYGDNLKRLMGRFRDELGVPDLPIIVGQMGQFDRWYYYQRSV